MKKLLITTAATLFTVAAFAQGTVYFSNGGFEKISSGVAGSAASTWAVVPAAANLLNFGLFSGTGATPPALTFLGSVSGVNSATSAGLIVNTSGGTITTLAIPGSPPGSVNVWVQIAGWSQSFGTDWAAAKAAAATTQGDYFGTSSVINVALTANGLGSALGPGAAIWQPASASDPTKIAGGFAVFTFGGGAVTPEPSTMALAGLGMAAMLIFRRRK